MSEPELPPPATRNFAITWPRTMPAAQLANQFAMSLGVPGREGQLEEIYLMIGHVDPPFLRPGDVDEQDPALESLEVDVRGRYVFTRNRLGELIRLLQDAADAIDNASGGDAP